mgnify:CR=1 FL=1
MKKTDAIRQCQDDQVEYGGVWHVVKLGPEENDYWTVHKSWFQRHDGKSIYECGGDEVHPAPPVARNVIYYINKFLLWLLNPFIKRARANNSNS